MIATHDRCSLPYFSVQEKQRSTFFSVFYLCINGGSLLSTIITPILRGRYEWDKVCAINMSACDNQKITVIEQLFVLPSVAQKCGIHSQQNCYPLAFGVPAALMVVALGMSKQFGDCDSIDENIWKNIKVCYILRNDSDVLSAMPLTVVFIIGNSMYYKAEPQGNIMLDVCKCIGVSLVYTICINTLCICCIPAVALGVSKTKFLFRFALLLISLPLKTATSTEAINTQRGSTGWTGQKKNMK